MPTADFKDEVTGEVFEVYFRSGPIPETVESEKGNLAKRVFSGTLGFEFKGTGFYETDYKKKGSNQ